MYTDHGFPDQRFRSGAAIAAYGDYQGRGETRRCLDRALATFDDLPFGRAFHPRLTAVVQPAWELGYKGARLLIERIEGKLPEAPVHLQLPTELKIRESMTARNEGPFQFERDTYERTRAAERVTGT